MSYLARKGYVRSKGTTTRQADGLVQQLFSVGIAWVDDHSSHIRGHENLAKVVHQRMLLEHGLEVKVTKVKGAVKIVMPKSVQFDNLPNYVETDLTLLERLKLAFNLIWTKTEKLKK